MIAGTKCGWHKSAAKENNSMRTACNINDNVCRSGRKRERKSASLSCLLHLHHVILFLFKRFSKGEPRPKGVGVTFHSEWLSLLWVTQNYESHPLPPGHVLTDLAAEAFPQARAAAAATTRGPDINLLARREHEGNGISGKDMVG
jgi:hypothetical protein